MERMPFSASGASNLGLVSGPEARRASKGPVHSLRRTPSNDSNLSAHSAASGMANREGRQRNAHMYWSNAFMVITDGDVRQREPSAGKGFTSIFSALLKGAKESRRHSSGTDLNVSQAFSA